MATKEPQYLTIFSILTRSTGSMLLLSPHQPSYWSAICDNPKWWGSVPDPLNRWLHRIIETVAQVTGSKPHFPFGGPSTHSSLGPWQVVVHGARDEWVDRPPNRKWGLDLVACASVSMVQCDHRYTVSGMPLRHSGLTHIADQ